MARNANEGFDGVLCQRHEYDRFRHDCEKCVYLGSTMPPMEQFPDGFVDWYACDEYIQSFGHTIIGRHGSEGPDYWSCPSKLIKITVEGGTYFLDVARDLVRIGT